MDRYTRLVELGWNMDLLRRGTVLVVGAGALGNEIIKNLALAGVGNVLVVDLDEIETHNLTRSVLFRGSDVGRRKAEVAAMAAADIEPRINVRWFDTPVQNTLGLGVFRNVDVVLGGLDNIQTRRDVNRACMLTETPFIDGGLYFLDGDVRTFLPPFPVCFDCTMTQDERDAGWRRWSCLGLLGDGGAGVGPTAPTVASMIGGLQVQLALKYLHRDYDGPYEMQVPNGVRIRFNGFADEY
ncbi:MAG: ThiF family adenylyltransferase, partial [SAR202 cluster bacterium]|nr:ThiF family adenylyltransferase [SAR202 cluster bacterium]